MKTSYEYISFEKLEAKTKTEQFLVKNKSSDFILGYVKWYGPWRKKFDKAAGKTPAPGLPAGGTILKPIIFSKEV